MNIRKHWKKVVLSCAALFWASCGDDASTKPILTAIDPDNTEASNSSASSAIALYGVPMYNISSSDVTDSCSSEAKAESNSAEEENSKPTSSEIAVNSSSNEATTSVNSSETPASSSSEKSSSSSADISSSSKYGGYKLASDTTVRCNFTSVYTYPFATTCNDVSLSLKYEPLSVEEIIKKENQLASCEGGLYESLYGVPQQRTYWGYNCSNGSTLYEVEGAQIIDGILYSKEEYYKAFPPSSEGIENLGCNKVDLISKTGIIDTLLEKNKSIVDSAINASEISESLKKEINSCKNQSYHKYIDESYGYYAKTKKCPDGTTSENETYTNYVEEKDKLIQRDYKDCIESAHKVDFLYNPRSVKEGEVLILGKDTCEVLSTYESNLNESNGYLEGAKIVADRLIEQNIDPTINNLTQTDQINENKQSCLENIKKVLIDAVTSKDTTQDTYAQDVKCSGDSGKRTTYHYNTNSSGYSKGNNTGYQDGNNNFPDAVNQMINDCLKL